MIDWLKETLLTSGILLGLVLLARRPFALWAGPKIAYTLWLVPVVRVLMPPLPVGGMTVLDLFSAVSSQGVVISAPQLRATGSQDWELLLALLWLGGAVAFLLFHLFCHFRFVQGLLAARSGKDMKIGRVQVWTSLVAQGPLAIGILRRQVVLPADFHSRFGEVERELVLAHELTHHRRGDLISNMAALVLLSLHWFNPLAHIAFRHFREDQELACDADVITAKGVASRYDYGRVLVKAACQRDSWPLCTLRPAEALKLRLKSLTGAHGKAHRGMATVTVFTVFAAVIVFVSPRMPPEQALDMVGRTETVPVPDRSRRIPRAPAAKSPDQSSSRRLSTARMTTDVSNEDNSSADISLGRRAALERLVETAVMQDAPALEARVEARHMKSSPRSPA
jgi:bla regulator protein blaR1